MRWLVLTALLTGCSEYDLRGQWPPKAGAQPDELEPGEIAEEYLQRTAVASDILFIIDDSGSMGDEQQNLADNFASFGQYLFDSDVDFHIGLLRGGLSDEPTDGVLEPLISNLERYVTNDIEAGESLFTMAVSNLGTGGGSGCESGLMAARLALSEPLAGSSGVNNGFYRDDAMLTVVIVTDENDNSTLEECRYRDAYPELWAPWFTGLKHHNAGRVNFGVIAGFDPADHTTPDACSSAGLGSADPAPIYGRVRDMVDGISWSICDPDWSSVMNDLGLAAAGLTRQFTLSRVPVWDEGDFDNDGNRDEPVLEVQLDRGNGFEDVQPAWASNPDSKNPWTYDPVLNAIIFEVRHMPKEGWVLRAVYPNSEES